MEATAAACAFGPRPLGLSPKLNRELGFSFYRGLRSKSCDFCFGLRVNKDIYIESWSDHSNRVKNSGFHLSSAKTTTPIYV
jgi:hypothetical protein